MPEREEQTNRLPEANGLMVPHLFRVESRRRDTPDTYTLTLRPASFEGEWSFAPGQFNMLTAFGIGEVPISISGHPSEPQRLTHTIRIAGAATRSLCNAARGDIIGVRGPFGTAWPVREAEGKDLIIVAGGLGLAPLRPAIYHALDRRPEYGNVELIYGARSPEDILYYRELQSWRGRFDLRVHVTVDTAPPEWRGRVGVVTKIIAQTRLDPAHTVALVCGPGVMIRFTVEELQAQGVSLDNIFVSLERNMQCGQGLCGHCQLGPIFICKDGPVFPFSRVKGWFEKREV